MKEENKIIFARTAITPVLKGLLPTDFVNVSLTLHVMFLAIKGPSFLQNVNVVMQSFRSQ